VAPLRFCLFTGFLFRRLFKMPTKLHFPEDAFTLQFFLERTKSLIDVIIAYDDLHLLSPAFQAIEVSFIDYESVSLEDEGGV
jgi:hypothetical protein|tara:strand:- start:671 stop:916 length:246 start_codon:yes stop_codon:yes gene_type:complete